MVSDEHAAIYTMIPACVQMALAAGINPLLAADGAGRSSILFAEWCVSRPLDSTSAPSGGLFGACLLVPITW